MSLVYPEVVGEDFKNHWKEGVAEADYHAERSAISSTSLRMVLKSPRHFFEFVIAGEPKIENDAMRFGKMVHEAILETDKFMSRYVKMPDFGDLRSSKNRESRDRWLSDLPQGAMPIATQDLDRLHRIIDAIANYRHPETGEPIIVNLLKNTVFEVSGYFRDPITGLKCRVRPDVLRQDLSAMPDLKTTRDPSPQFFSREIWSRGYHVQMAFYAMGVKAITGKDPQLPCFIAVQNEAPFDVAVYECDEVMMERGSKAVRHGLDLIKECMDRQEWPGVQRLGAETISLPPYTDNIWEWQ